MVYHITSASEAVEAGQFGEYVPADFDSDGFIHCGYVHQVTAVANFRFRGRDGLVLFEIDPSKVPCEIRDENLEGGKELFPHIYGRLPMVAVVAVYDFPCRANGLFELPSGVHV